MRKTMRVLVLACGLSTFGGCASIMGRGPDLVPVSSDPPGAVVRLNGTIVARTPTVVSLDRSAPGILEFEKPGYRPARAEVPKVVNDWVFGNFLWGPIWIMIPAGILVDVSAGHSERFAREPIHVVLKPEIAGRRP